MTYYLKEVFSGGSSRFVATVEDLDEARLLLPGDIVVLEEDADHPGCFDILTATRGAARQWTLEEA